MQTPCTLAGNYCSPNATGTLTEEHKVDSWGDTEYLGGNMEFQFAFTLYECWVDNKGRFANY